MEAKLDTIIELLSRLVERQAPKWVVEDKIPITWEECGRPLPYRRNRETGEWEDDPKLVARYPHLAYGQREDWEKKLIDEYRLTLPAYEKLVVKIRHATTPNERK
jgi:hypothetical protein